MNTMHPYRRSGLTVIYANPQNGFVGDQEEAARYLTLGATYTIARTEVGSMRTAVFLKEFPGIAFNSVHFSNGLD